MRIDREKIKQIAKEKDLRVKQLLALSPGNDPFYIRPNHFQKAKWFTKIWEEEGKPIIHPRGLHYQILGKGYKFGKEKKPYRNTRRCWNYLQAGCKYARLLGLVPYDKIKDEKNPEPRNVPREGLEQGFKPSGDSAITFGYYCNLKINSYLEYDSTEDLIDSLVSSRTYRFMEDVEFDSYRRQPNYLEIWAEKKGVIPSRIEWYPITIREAGGGEMSLDMCYQAVKRAKELDKDLHIFLLVDFDPKGRDMPKSVARKVEKIARELDVKAYVHHTALTLEQCKKYALPTEPARKPKGGGRGAKAYKEHTKIFKEFAGQDPTEINAFQSREPVAYKEAIEGAIEPYFDQELSENLREAKNDLKEEIEERIREDLEGKEEEIEELREEVKEKVEELKVWFEDVKEESGLHEKVEEFAELLFLDKEVVEGLELEEPEVEVSEPRQPLLDTTRDYIDQIKEYKKFDVR